MTHTNKDISDETSKDDAPKATSSSKPGHKYVVFSAMLTILLALGIVFYSSNKSKEKTEETKVGLSETVQKSEVLLANKDFDEALSEWSKFTESKTAAEDKVQGHLGIASVYMNKQDYPAALESYKRAEQLSPQPKQSIYNGIISIARMNNDKALEIEYSRKAIDALDKNHPLYEADKSSYERRIEELNAEPN